MTYKIAYPEAVQQKVESWELPSDVLADALSKLRDILCLDSLDAAGTRVVAPVRCVCIKLSIGDHDFRFWVNDQKKKDTRIVIDADLG